MTVERARILSCALVLVAAASTASAQGRGNAIGNGRNKGGSQATVETAAPASGGTVAPGAVRQFGSWLDDATMPEPGSGWFSIGLGRYSSPVGHQTDFPSLDTGYAWSPRVQFSATLPYSRFTTTDGYHASGRGDTYLSAKLLVRDNARGRTPIAITPLLEFLSDPNPENGRRVFWGVPVSTEFQAERFRVYGSAGYFSRGALFAGSALEIPATDRLTATGVLTLTRSLGDTADVQTAATRLDFSAGASFLARPTLALYGSFGRTLSRIDENSSTLMLSGGVAFLFTR